MTYNARTNTLSVRGVYIDIEPTTTYGYVAKVSNKLYSKLKVNTIVNWKQDNGFSWHLLITKKANNKVWFYLP